MSLLHCILGALADKPMTGYDLNKSFQETIVHFWSTDQSQIYRTLQKLKKTGWVSEETVVQHDRPNRKVYHITESGRNQLREWLQQPITEAQAPVREGWLGQLFYANHSELSQTARVMQHYLEETETKREELSQIYNELVGSIDSADMQFSLRLATLEYGIALQAAGAQWLRQLLAKLGQQNL